VAELHHVLAIAGTTDGWRKQIAEERVVHRYPPKSDLTKYL
jgi:hypothetical protein